MTRGPVICTLFEGTYGIGAAALINSLVAAGFTGKGYVGVRGALPAWAVDVQKNGGWIGSEGTFCLSFITIDTDWHLTNYKPAFMMHILEALEADAGGIIYFDPDITIRCKWDFFQQWLECGMMFCEDVSSPMHTTHPRRIIWRRLFPDLLKDAPATSDSYVNAGFVGVRRQDLKFLQTWLSVIEQAAPFTGGPDRWYGNSSHEPFSPFAAYDQDALNIALMANTAPVSIVGREGMDFQPGGYTMSHAIGPTKPWIGGFCKRALVGRAPSVADRWFVKYVSAGPLKPLNSLQLAIMQADLLSAKIVSKLIH